MKNKIDQFFKDKLEDHSLSSSDEAWAKIDANLSKKNNVAVWRIAAAILITGALVSVIIWSQRGAKNHEQILAIKKSQKDNSTKEKPVVPVSQIEKKEEAKPVQKKLSTASAKQFVSPQTSLPRSASSQTENNSDQKNGETETEPMKTSSAVAETNVAASENKQEEKINTKATKPATTASTKRKPIKLEFTLESFSAEQTVATMNEVKTSGIKKVWGLALEVKNGDGRVREIKNELFARNFKKIKSQ